jgi:hypothetical protein
VTIPAGVTQIRDNAFYFCGNLHSACLMGGAPTRGLDVFFAATDPARFMRLVVLY